MFLVGFYIGTLKYISWYTVLCLSYKERKLSIGISVRFVNCELYTTEENMRLVNSKNQRSSETHHLLIPSPFPPVKIKSMPAMCMEYT